jgi:hypothetical protein
MDETGGTKLEREFGGASVRWVVFAVSLLLSTAGVACGGAGPELQDGASGDPAPAATTSSASQPFSTPTGEGCGTDQGCPCEKEGATTACEGPLMRDGDYVTCAGARACFHGAWGPCIPPTYHSSGSSGDAR